MGLKVVFCVGEEIKDEEGNFREFIEQQINEGLRGLSQNLMKGLIIAYRGGLGDKRQCEIKADNPESAFRMAVFIRKILMDIAGNELARKIPILYGGSVGSETPNSF